MVELRSLSLTSKIIDILPIEQLIVGFSALVFCETLSDRKSSWE